MPVGQRISQLPTDATEVPVGADRMPFVDMSAGRSEYCTVDQLAESPAFTDRGVVLVWNGTNDYEPYTFKTLVSPKEFRGPTDPSTVPGVVLNAYDTWVDTSP